MSPSSGGALENETPRNSFPEPQEKKLKVRRAREETKHLSSKRRFTHNGILDFRAKKGGKDQEGFLGSGRRLLELGGPMAGS